MRVEGRKGGRRAAGAMHDAMRRPGWRGVRRRLFSLQRRPPHQSFH